MPSASRRGWRAPGGASSARGSESQEEVRRQPAADEALRLRTDPVVSHGDVHHRAIDDCNAAVKEDIIQGFGPWCSARRKRKKQRPSRSCPLSWISSLRCWKRRRRSAASLTASIVPRVPACHCSSSPLQDFRSRSVTERQATSGRASIQRSRRWWNECRPTRSERVRVVEEFCGPGGEKMAIH